ncbi:MAG: GCN5-related N-acetyltransferase [Nevskia sp.]|nr:GCN5-related N-acetyltransferase [Nevskia sp.]
MLMLQPHKPAIRPMTIADYDAVIELMRQTPGISLRDADSRAATAMYLERNPGLSHIAEARDRIIGCIMCGHDGRRGYLQHLLVVPEFRRQGIANALVEASLRKLGQLGIHKCHIDVLKTNTLASTYWESQGWKLRTDIHRYSFIRSDDENV